uniref:Tetraspanin n=1 Tax=Clastoptera arizonana TaxID=38151 RepID=A0A1B6E043_9HEMI
MDTFGMSCVKYLLFVFNLFFAISGIVLFTVGILIQQKYNYDYSQFIDEKMFTAPMLLIIAGVIVFVVASFGCCGAIKESNFILITYAILLFLIFNLEVAGGISGYLMKEDIHDMLQERMNSSMLKYNTSPEITKPWNVLQYDLRCCGVESKDDWLIVYPNGTIPHSCCQQLAINEICTSQDASPTGCLSSLKDVLETYIIWVGGFALGVAFVQLIGVLFACCLAYSIRQGYQTV